MFTRSAFAALLWLLTLPTYAAAAATSADSPVPASIAPSVSLRPAITKLLSASPVLHVRLPKLTYQPVFSWPTQAGLPDAPLAAMVGQLPVMGALRKRAGEHFNTTDSSHPNDFAICYRLSRRMGLQVVPGDATPPQRRTSSLPTPSSVAVAFGMTIRMDRLK